jgi:uncharacterized protein YjdB
MPLACVRNHVAALGLEQPHTAFKPPEGRLIRISICPKRRAAGKATGLAAGSATIQATLGSISGTTTLTVQPALVSITVAPLNPSVAVGHTVQFTATGTYSDNTTQDVTSSVTWTTTKPGVATIDNSGLAIGISKGKTNVRAKLGGATASTQLTVTP